MVQSSFSLLTFTLFFLILTPSLSHGCPKTCGSLEFSYPFGVGPGCSMDPSFDIICNKTAHPSKPYLNITSLGGLLEVVEVNSSWVRVKYPYLLAATCYTNTTVYPHNITRDEAYIFDLRETQYVVSDKNWLTALGCDDIVVGFRVDKTFVAGGCVSFCDSKEPKVGVCPNSENRNSAGIGCCRSSIAKGTTYIGAQLKDLGGVYIADKIFPCSYAFLVEKQMSSNRSVFKYSFSDLNKSSSIISKGDDSWPLNSITPPVVRLDWRIGAQNCSEAGRNLTSYACKNHTYCTDFDGNGLPGYLCHCEKGYHGNPYEGCEDINECRDLETSPCILNSLCSNTEGNVRCVCPNGYEGDGLKNGKGCIPLKMVNVFIGIGSGMGFLMLLCLCILVHIIWRKRRNQKRKQKFFKRNGGLLLQQQTNGGTSQKTKLFSVEELEKATDNFNESRVLGQGGQGTVYKGMLSDGKIVAIKKSKHVNTDQLEQFINEVVIVSQISHKNVVKLWGCCLETDVPLLVYELVPNGTLFDLIHDPTTEFQVSWNMRLKIATDVAGALAYLHSALSIPIYHRDIKSSNILLDEKYIVKLSDFGISRSVATDRTHLTTLVKGTFGYFDPEYFQSSQFTEKSDVYSFGVVLVELLTGKKPISSDVREEERSLAARFLDSMEEDNFYSILDPQVSKQANQEEVNGVASLARRCLNWKGKMRPTMKVVATELESLMISDEARVTEAKSMMISDIEYTWNTTSGRSETYHSSDIHPINIETI